MKKEKEENKRKNIKKMEKIKKTNRCPVCKTSNFVECKYGEVCDQCGWIKDEKKLLYLKDHKKFYKTNIAKNPQYRWRDEVIRPCPVCNEKVFPISSFDTYFICEQCGWEDDQFQNDNPDNAGGANGVSLNRYKVEYEETVAKNPQYRWWKDFDKK
jgi:hypothetical protein